MKKHFLVILGGKGERFFNSLLISELISYQKTPPNILIFSYATAVNITVGYLYRKINPPVFKKKYIFE